MRLGKMLEKKGKRTNINMVIEARISSSQGLFKGTPMLLRPIMVEKSWACDFLT